MHYININHNCENFSDICNEDEWEHAWMIAGNADMDECVPEGLRKLWNGIKSGEIARRLNAVDNPDFDYKRSVIEDFTVSKNLYGEAMFTAGSVMSVSDKQVDALANLLSDESMDEDKTAQILSTLYSTPYMWTTIRGSVQREWNILYISEIDFKMNPWYKTVDLITSWYFGTGTDVAILNTDDDSYEDFGEAVDRAIDEDAYADFWHVFIPAMDDSDVHHYLIKHGYIGEPEIPSTYGECKMFVDGKPAQF